MQHISSIRLVSMIVALFGIAAAAGVLLSVGDNSPSVRAEPLSERARANGAISPSAAMTTPISNQNFLPIISNGSGQNNGSLTSTVTLTNTLLLAATSTPTPRKGEVQVKRKTKTPLPTNTSTPTPTATPTNTPVPPTATNTPTAIPSITPAVAARALGTATVHTGPTACADQECYTLEISCSQVSRPEGVTVKVGAPTGGVAEKGVILFFTGWVGNYFWAEEGFQVAVAASSELNASFDSIQHALDNNTSIIADLRAAGFRTVQVQWNNGWFIAEEGQRDEDFGTLACKPATVARWVYDNIRTDQNEVFCATGHSNGASQLAYMMTQYQLADLFSLVVFEGGPNWARVDHSCLPDATHTDLYGEDGERNTIDWAFGYLNDGSGICAQRVVSEIVRFQNASLALNPWFYVYPNTQVAFLIGENDATTTANHGEYFYNWLVNAGTPLITYETVPGADHFTTEVQAGADMMKNKLLTECRVR